MGRIVLLFSLSLSLLSALTVVPAAGQFANNYSCSVLLIPAFLSGGIFFKRYRQEFLLMGFLCVIVFSTMYARARNEVRFCLNGTISAIEGYMIQDSSPGKNGNRILSLCLTGCRDNRGNRATARGSITAITEQDILVCAGSKVKLEGRLSNNIFVCSSVKVTEKNRLEYVRSNLILIFRKNLESCPLGEMLILGRADTESGDSELRELARSCGCLHVLALSGMHLNVIGGTVYKLICGITKRRKAARLVSFIPATAFVFIAGPRPSLVRAYIMSLLFFLEPEERIAMGFFIQLALFPWSIFNSGSAYGYISVTAIFVLSPLAKGTLENFLPRPAASALGVSVSVIVFNAPLQLLLEGKWYPAAILSGPVSAFIIDFQMFLALLCLAFPNLGVVHLISQKSAALLENVFRLASGIPSLGPCGYLLFLACCLLVFLFVKICKISFSKP